VRPVLQHRAHGLELEVFPTTASSLSKPEFSYYEIEGRATVQTGGFPLTQPATATSGLTLVSAGGSAGQNLAFIQVTDQSIVNTRARSEDTTWDEMEPVEVNGVRMVALIIDNRGRDPVRIEGLNATGRVVAAFRIPFTGS
jgi:hypothetical protein